MSRRAVYFFAASLVLLMACSSVPESVWTRADSRTADHLHNGFFIDDRNGWIVSYGAGRLLRTTDGGVTWNPSYVGAKLLIRGLRFLDQTNGWGVGHRGAAWAVC